MTFGEKALENLINGEVERMRMELKEELLRELDDRHKDIKRFGGAFNTNEYSEINARLVKLQNPTLVDANYEEIA